MMSKLISTSSDQTPPSVLTIITLCFTFPNTALIICIMFHITADIHHWEMRGSFD